jgi:hypothetical protein
LEEFLEEKLVNQRWILLHHSAEGKSLGRIKELHVRKYKENKKLTRDNQKQ